MSNQPSRRESPELSRETFAAFYRQFRCRSARRSGRRVRLDEVAESRPRWIPATPVDYEDSV